MEDWFGFAERCCGVIRCCLEWDYYPCSSHVREGMMLFKRYAYWYGDMINFDLSDNEILANRRAPVQQAEKDKRYKYRWRGSSVWV